MKKMMFLLALVLGLHLQAQELDICTKPYGEEQEIIVIKPTVANFVQMLSMDGEQFKAAMEKYSYIDQEFGGEFLAYWNGSHDNFNSAKCVNAYLYYEGKKELHFVVGRQMVYPQGSIMSLMRDLRPYFKEIKRDEDRHRVEVFEMKDESSVYEFKLYHNPQFFYFIVTYRPAE